MSAVRASDGRTIHEILELEVAQGLRPDPADAMVGFAWCDDPDCPEWGEGAVEHFWNHQHPLLMTVYG